MVILTSLILVSFLQNVEVEGQLVLSHKTLVVRHDKDRTTTKDIPDDDIWDRYIFHVPLKPQNNFRFHSSSNNIEYSPSSWYKDSHSVDLSEWRKVFDTLSLRTAYSGTFSGDLIPITEDSGGEGPPPDYSFTAEASGAVDDFVIDPSEKRIPIGQTPNFTVYKHGEIYRNFTWLVCEDFDSPGDIDEAGSYTITAEDNVDDDYSDDVEYLPTGIEEFEAHEFHNSDNVLEINVETPIKAEQNAVDWIRIPYIFDVDDNFKSVTRIRVVKATPYPKNEWPDDKPAWEFIRPDDSTSSFSGTDVLGKNLLLGSRGEYTLNVECGNKLTILVEVESLDITVESFALTTTFAGGVEFTAIDAETGIKLFVKELIKTIVKDEFDAWSKINSVWTTASTYAQNVAKMSKASLLQYTQIIENLKLEVTFNIQDSSGNSVSDSVFLIHEGSCPNDPLYIGWEEYYPAVLDNYQAILKEAAKEINKKAFQIYLNDN